MNNISLTNRIRRGERWGKGREGKGPKEDGKIIIKKKETGKNDNQGMRNDANPKKLRIITTLQTKVAIVTY